MSNSKRGVLAWSIHWSPYCVQLCIGLLQAIVAQMSIQTEVALYQMQALEDLPLLILILESALQEDHTKPSLVDHFRPTTNTFEIVCEPGDSLPAS